MRALNAGRLKQTVNETLARVTGYEIVKAGTATRAREAARAGRTVGPPPAPAPPPKPKAAPKPEFPADYDDEAREIIRAVRPWTMTSSERLNALILATRYVCRYQVPGAVVECGVWRGGSMQAAARTLLSCKDTSRDLYLFDTFEGMPEATEKDLRQDGTPAADLLARLPKDNPIWAVAGLDDVRAGMAALDYPAERVHFVQGRVEETVPDQAPDQIAILRLDTDWYESTRHELRHLYDRLVPGGVLLIDDYGWWQGSRTAVEEFLDETGARLLLLRMDEGRVAVKP